MDRDLDKYFGCSVACYEMGTLYKRYLLVTMLIKSKLTGRGPFSKVYTKIINPLCKVNGKFFKIFIDLLGHGFLTIGSIECIILENKTWHQSPLSVLKNIFNQFLNSFVIMRSSVNLNFWRKEIGKFWIGDQWGDKWKSNRAFSTTKSSQSTQDTWQILFS